MGGHGYSSLLFCLFSVCLFVTYESIIYTRLDAIALRLHHGLACTQQASIVADFNVKASLSTESKS